MRFFGFLTGIAVLILLFVIISDPQVFSDNKNLLQDMLLKNKPETAKEKAIKLRDGFLAAENSSTSGSANQAGPATEQSSPVVTDGITKPQMQLETADLEKDNKVIMSTKRSLEQVDTGKLSVKTEVGNSNLTVAKIEELKQIDGIKQELFAIENSFSKQQDQWHTFWGPFNTRSSAQGFADNLADRTEVEFKVIKTKPGTFMVAYPYKSEVERQTIETLIERRTGLVLDNR